MNPSCKFTVSGAADMPHNHYTIPVFADDSVERIKERIWYTLKTNGRDTLLYEEIYLYQYSSEPADLPKLFSLLPNREIRREQLIPLLSFPVASSSSTIQSVIPDAMNLQELMHLLETQKWTLAMKHPIGARFSEDTPWPAECDPFVFVERRLRHRRPKLNNRRPDVKIHLIHNDNTLWTDVSSTIHVCLASDLYRKFQGNAEEILLSNVTKIFYPVLNACNVTDQTTFDSVRYMPDVFRKYDPRWLDYHNKMDESLAIMRMINIDDDIPMRIISQGIRRLHIELNDVNTDTRSQVRYCRTLAEDCRVVEMESIFKCVHISDLIPFIIFCDKDKCIYRVNKVAAKNPAAKERGANDADIRKWIRRFQVHERISFVIQVARLHNGMGADMYDYVYFHIVPDTATKTKFALQIELKMKDSAICPQDKIHDLMTEMMASPLPQINRCLRSVGKMEFRLSGKERILYMDYCVLFPTPKPVNWEKFPCIDAVIYRKPTTHATPIKKKSSRSRLSRSSNTMSQSSSSQQDKHSKYYWRRVEKGATLPFRVQMGESKWTIYRITDWNYLPIIEQQMNGIMALSTSSKEFTRLKQLDPYVQSIVHPVEGGEKENTDSINYIVEIAPIYEDDVYDDDDYDDAPKTPLIGSVGGAAIIDNSDISDNEEEEEQQEEDATELYMRRLSNQFCAITPNNIVIPVIESEESTPPTVMAENEVGYLPRAVTRLTGNNHRFMRQGIHHPTAYVVSDNNTHYVQSFLGYITFLYNLTNNVSVDAEQMREIIVDAVDLDTFVKAQSGKLLAIFSSLLSEAILSDRHILSDDSRIKMMDADDENEMMEEFDHSQIYHSVDWNNDAHAKFMMTAIRAYRKFQQHIRDPHSFIDHTILWDILSLPNRKLFAHGFNIVMMELFPGDSYLERVEFICPQSIFSLTSHSSPASSNQLSASSPSVIILKTGVYYEPIICMDDSSPFSKYIFDDDDDIVHMVNTWKSAACDDNSNIKINHVPNALTMKELQSRCKNSHFCAVESYIVNREKTEITGVHVNFASDPDLTLFLPIVPCAILPSFSPLIHAPIPQPFLETYSLLRKHQVKMRCHPLRMVAISDGQWIVGILIETNGFIPTEPIEKTDVPDEIARNLAVYHHRGNVRMPILPMNRRNPHFKEEEEQIDELDLLRHLKMERQFYSVFAERLLQLIQGKKLASVQQTTQNLESELRKLAKGHIAFVDMDANVALMYMEECESASPLSFAPLSFAPSSFAPSSFAPSSFAPSSFAPSSFSPSSCAMRSEIDGTLLIPRTSLLHPHQNNDDFFFEKFAKDFALRDREALISFDDDNRVNDPQNARYVIGPNESIYAIHPDMASRNLFRNLRIDM